jgi:hypothetical protein
MRSLALSALLLIGCTAGQPDETTLASGSSCTLDVDCDDGLVCRPTSSGGNLAYMCQTRGTVAALCASSSNCQEGLSCSGVVRAQLSISQAGTCASNAQGQVAVTIIDSAGAPVENAALTYASTQREMQNQVDADTLSLFAGPWQLTASTYDGNSPGAPVTVNVTPNALVTVTVQLAAPVR